MQTSAADLAWIRALAAEAGASRAPAGVVRPALAAKLDSAVSTYNEERFGSGRPPAVQAGSERDYREAVARVSRRITEHPLFRVAGAGDTGPVQITDVLSERRWRAHPVYAELIAPAGVPPHAVALVVGAGGGLLRWYMFNRDRPFDDREMDLLGRLQPVLIAAHRRRPPAADGLLTPRELEVLRAVAEGLTVAAVARRLGVAPGTVRKHLENVHRKLGTSGPVDTVLRGVTLGLVDLP